MTSSRFDHFNQINGSFNADDQPMDTPDGYSTSSNKTMTVTAGVRLKHPANTGSFVTAVISGSDKPHYDKATVIKAPSNGQNGQGGVVIYNNLDEGIRENGQFGQVSFSNEETRDTYSWFKGMLGNSNQSKTVTFPILNPVKPVNITVRNIENSRKCEFQMSSTDTVDQLKHRIHEKSGWVTEGRQLILDGKNLTSGKILQDYEFRDRSEILLSCRNRGG